MTTQARHTGLLTLALGAALVTFLLVWQAGPSESSATPRDTPTHQTTTASLAAPGGARVAARQRNSVTRGPGQRGFISPSAPLTPAHMQARAVAVIGWRTELDQRIAPCMPTQGPRSLRTIEFSFACDAAESDDTTQRFEVAAVNLEPGVDDEPGVNDAMEACLRESMGMSVDVMFEAQPAEGCADFIESVTMPL